MRVSFAVAARPPTSRAGESIGSVADPCTERLDPAALAAQYRVGPLDPFAGPLTEVADSLSGALGTVGVVGIVGTVDVVCVGAKPGVSATQFGFEVTADDFEFHRRHRRRPESGERLVESDLYHGAWIGDVSDTNGAPRPRVTAGGVELPMDEITEGPVVTALESRSIQAVEDCRDTPGFSCSSDGSCSGLAVPLPWGSSSGVLVVCSGRSDAFSERERAAFGVLGTVLGAALPALRHQELLFGDEITELTFDVPDTHSAFVRASIAHACRIEDDDFVLTDGTGVHFVRVSDADPDAVLETLLAEEGFEDGRVVSQTDDGGTLALRHYGSSMVLLLIEQGARVTEAVSDCGETKVVAELPPGADVRRVVERAQASFPDAKLVGKRRIERPDAAAATFPGNAVEELTERQRGALRTAYRAGYYEWPRESTAEEVAATMGIASATLHQHLRAAERKLLGALFDARP